MRIANFVMIPVFLMCVIVQYNDPDPIRWMLIYGAALICCILFAVRKMPKWLPMCVALVALIWAATIPPSFWGKHIPAGEVFSMIHMIHPGVEEVREMGGLLIVAGWMFALWFQVRKLKRGRTNSTR